MDNSTDIISMLRYLEHLRLLIDHMQCEQPYRLNVIDELHINENGHSRILTKLLQYRAADGTYVFLESLLHYINAKKKTNFPNKVSKARHYPRRRKNRLVGKRQRFCSYL